MSVLYGWACGQWQKSKFKEFVSERHTLFQPCFKAKNDKIEKTTWARHAVYNRLLAASAAAEILAIYRESREIHESAAGHLTFPPVKTLRDQSTTKY